MKVLERRLKQLEADFAAGAGQLSPQEAVYQALRAGLESATGREQVRLATQHLLSTMSPRQAGIFLAEAAAWHDYEKQDAANWWNWHTVYAPRRSDVSDYALDLLIGSLLGVYPGPLALPDSVVAVIAAQRAQKFSPSASRYCALCAYPALEGAGLNCLLCAGKALPGDWFKMRLECAVPPDPDSDMRHWFKAKVFSEIGRAAEKGQKFQ
jgi:hypothetical protein